MSQRAQNSRGHSSSHMLKTGRRGSPFMKDTHDLFSTLMVSLPLTTNTRFFRSFPSTFTTDDACQHLAQLRFSQSNRTVDPNDPNRIITTTTTTTFSMNRDIAKGISQYFMDARLIENAVDPGSPNFKDRGIYKITPKGMHILERFISKNGISADSLLEAFRTTPISLRLLHLERLQTDDEINIHKPLVDLIWKRFAGERKPNYFIEPAECAKGREYTYDIFEGRPRLPENFDRGLGVEVQDLLERSATNRANNQLIRHVFHSHSAIDYLCDYATISCRDEAAEVLAHLVRYGYITMYKDATRSGDRSQSAFVMAPVTEKEMPGVLKEGEFRYGSRVLYRFTDEGRMNTSWEKSWVTGNGPNDKQQVNVSLRNLKSSSDGNSVDDDSSSTKSGKEKSKNAAITLDSRASVADLFRIDHLGDDPSNSANWSRESSSYTRLNYILHDSGLKHLFKEFLKSSYSDENLAFYIDVNEFKNKFKTTSSAVSTNPNAKRKQVPNAASAMELHSQSLVVSAITIYSTYLAPFSPSELNIDHSLRKEVVDYMTSTLATYPQFKNRANGSGSEGVPTGLNQPLELDPSEVPPLKATQVQTMLRLYEKIQEHCFRLLATDQVPKVSRWVFVLMSEGMKLMVDGLPSLFERKSFWPLLIRR